VAAKPTIASRTTRIEMSKVDRAADVWRGAGDVSRRLLVAIGGTMRTDFQGAVGARSCRAVVPPSTWCSRSE
jgi:hypothetical protein